MEDYSYMCGECFQFCDNIDAFIHHVCHNNSDNVSVPENRTESQKRERSNVTPGTPEPSVPPDQATVHICNEKIPDKGLLNTEIRINEGYMSSGQEYSAVDVTEDEDVVMEVGEKKRKKYHAMADEYRVNRIMRDKDFKLGRTHLYSFKDTLGDWDERSTKLLIQLIHKYPKSHFLLPMKSERRLGHWECIHQEMGTAGYTFTVLQLRMRWREVLQKYRWTVDYNDSHEIKKKCEYFDEMNEIFGDWDEEATRCLLKQMYQINLENNKKKIVRIGYVGWEKITASLNSEGHRLTIDMVEARWRNMVTLYKTMIDHNALPNVEPQSVAYKEELEKLVNYIPKRRQMYEKVKGRSVKMERFPTNGIKVLLQAYKDCIGQFMETKTRNTSVWDGIRQKLEEGGYRYTTPKLKDILNGIIKGYEKSQYHNSLPGAIRRDVPYYRELSEIYGTHGRWPHIQTSRTIDMRNRRKFRLRLQASQQLWSSEESRALLEIYPDVLETHVNQNVSHQASDLWLQVAKAYAATGFAKRDVPEIAVHIGLLRLGYSQGNLFPFLEEMRKVKETEEAVCYSPDVSKFMGDVEVIYWSHAAVRHLLELYLKHQASMISQSLRDEVFIKIRDDMQNMGYGYTKEQIFDHFKTLITQYRTRTSKLWGESTSSRKTSNPTGAPYLEKLEKVCQLRRRMSLSWTSGVTPLDIAALNIVYKVALKKAEELFQNSSPTDENKMIPQLIEQIQSHIRTKQLLETIPRTRQIRLHLASALRRFHEHKDDDGSISKLHKLLEANNMTNFYTNVKRQDILNMAGRSLKRRRKCKVSSKRKGMMNKYLEHGNSSSDDEFLESSSPNLKKRHARTLALKSSNCNQGCLSEACDVQRQSKDGILYCDDLTEIERESAPSPVDERSLSIVNEGTIQDDAFILDGMPQDSVSDVKCNSDSKFETSLISCSSNKGRTNVEPKMDKGKIVIQTSCTKVCKKACKYSASYNSGSILHLNYNNKCSKNEANVSESRSEDKITSSSLSISDITISRSVDVSENSTHDVREELHQGPVCEKIKTEPETRIIQTRSGRRTRFTFFAESLSENFEADIKKNGDEVICSLDRSHVEHKQMDICTSGDVDMPIRRRRGRPCKPKDTRSPLYCSVENDSIVFEREDSANKCLKSDTELTSIQSQERPCIVKEPFAEPSNSFVDGIFLIEDKGFASISSTSSTKLNENEGYSKTGISVLLEMHQAERKEKEIQLLNILEKHQAKQTIALQQMLGIFEDLRNKLCST